MGHPIYIYIYRYDFSFNSVTQGTLHIQHPVIGLGLNSHNTCPTMYMYTIYYDEHKFLLMLENMNSFHF